MHARVIRAQVQPDKMDEVLDILRDSLVSVVKAQEGFKGLLTLADHKADKAMMITLWETRADMMATETDGYLQDQMTKVAHLLAGPPTREHYEVGVQV